MSKRERPKGMKMRRRGIEAARQLADRARRGGNKGGGVMVELGGGEGTWTPLLMRYLERLGTLHYSERTVRARRSGLGAFLRWCGERELRAPQDITRPVLEAYQRFLSKSQEEGGRPLGWSTQRGRLTALKGWFAWMTRQNILIHNPASELEMPRMGKRLQVHALSLGELASLLKVPNTEDPLGLRDRAMLELFYSCGLRRSELCNLELGDMTIERATLLIRHGKGDKDRMVPVGARALFWVKRYLAEARPRLSLDTRTQAFFLTGYGGAFHPDVLSRMAKNWMKRAGLEGRGSCHLLRHTCATHMLEGGADIRYIQQLLGHEKLETTAIYTEVTIRQLQEVHARCHPSGRIAIEGEEERAYDECRANDLGSNR